MIKSTACSLLYVYSYMHHTVGDLSVVLSQMPGQQSLRPGVWMGELMVPTLYKAYFLGLCQGMSPQNMAGNMVPPF